MRAAGTVPVARFEAFKFVRPAPLPEIVTPLIVPPVMLTLAADWLAIEPSPANVSVTCWPSWLMTDMISRKQSLVALGHMPSGAPTGGAAVLSAGSGL